MVFMKVTLMWDMNPRSLVYQVLEAEQEYAAHISGVPRGGGFVG